MKAARRLAFARARTPVAVAMRIVAAALAERDPQGCARRSVFVAPRQGRRAAPRAVAAPKGPMPPRGCEDLH